MLTIPRKVSEILRLRAGDEVEIGIVSIRDRETMVVDPVKKPNKRGKK